MAKIELGGIKDKAKTLAEKGKAAAEKGAEKAKEGAAAASEKISDAKYEFDLKTINPVSRERLESFDYQIPSLIQIMEHDRKMDNPVCENALGFQEKIKDKNLLCIMNQFVEQTSIQFAPYLTKTIYCRNPYIENMYISLDEYFAYIDNAKVHELEMVAQSLGAKKVKISFKKKKKTLVSNVSEVKSKNPFAKIGKVEASVKHETTETEFADISIASQIEFDGGKAPVKPELVYFKGNADIETLIKMRLDSENALTSKTYSFACGKGKELQLNDAARIDVVLAKKGMGGNTSIVSEVQEEQRKVLEYSIEF